jgi:hypothetical protein
MRFISPASSTLCPLMPSLQPVGAVAGVEPKMVQLPTPAPCPRISYRITFGCPQRQHPPLHHNLHPQRLLPHHQLSALEKLSDFVARPNFCMIETKRQPPCLLHLLHAFGSIVTFSYSTLTISIALWQQWRALLNLQLATMILHTPALASPTSPPPSPAPLTLSAQT